jgi:hypothetical protein
MEMCPPLLVDSVVDRIRPPYPRCAPGAHRDGTVEAPGSAWTTGERPVRRSRHQTASAPDGAGS